MPLISTSSPVQSAERIKSRGISLLVTDRAKAAPLGMHKAMASVKLASAATKLLIVLFKLIMEDSFVASANWYYQQCRDSRKRCYCCDWDQVMFSPDLYILSVHGLGQGQIRAGFLRRGRLDGAS